MTLELASCYMKNVLSKTQTRVKEWFPRTEIYLEIFPRKRLLHWQQKHMEKGSYTGKQKLTVAGSKGKNL